MNDQKNIWIVGNWKARVPLEKMREWISIVGPALNPKSNQTVVVCPQFSLLAEVRRLMDVGHYPFGLGSQDLSAFDPGAYTGEEPAQYLKDFIQYAIIGHSERRVHLKESDDLIHQKVNQAIRHEITPILCVQDANTPIPEGVTLVAYEPVFAIGTGNPDTPENANSVAAKIKEAHPQVHILYGGSVTSANVQSFLQQEHLEGVLVGTASIDPKEYLAIVTNSQ